MKKTTTRKSDFIITGVFAFGIYALLDNQLFGIFLLQTQDFIQSEKRLQPCREVNFL